MIATVERSHKRITSSANRRYLCICEVDVGSQSCLEASVSRIHHLGKPDKISRRAQGEESVLSGFHLMEVELSAHRADTILIVMVGHGNGACVAIGEFAQRLAVTADFARSIHLLMRSEGHRALISAQRLCP